MRRFLLVLAAFSLGFALTSTQTPISQAAQKSDTKKGTGTKAAEKITYLVNEDFRDVKGSLPAGWANRANKSEPSVVTANLGAIHPTAGTGRVFHSFDVPAAIEGNFIVELKFSSYRQPEVAKGKPQLPNLGVLFLDAKGKPASKDGVVQVWQEANDTFATQGGFLTLKANGDDTSRATKPVRMSGEGTPHTIRLERKGSDYEIIVNSEVIYTGTLGDLGKQSFSGVRIGMLGGDNLMFKKGGKLKMEPVFTMVHFVKIGLKK
jgi:hypothetical protein